MLLFAADYLPNLPMSRQSSLIGTQKYASPNPSIPITIPTHLPRPLADAESILPKHAAAVTEAANTSFAPWAQPSSSRSVQFALDTIQESDEATLDCDMHVVAKPDNPTHTAVHSDGVPMLVEVQQAVQQQQQEQRSPLGLTQSVHTDDLGGEQPVQQQTASDVVSEVAATAEQHAYTPVQQLADSVEGAVVSVFEQQRPGAEGCSLTSSQEGHRSSFVKVSVSQLSC